MPTPDNHVTDDVAAAFAMLLDELEAALQEVNRAGAQAFGAGDYAEVERLKQKGGRIGGMMDRAKDMAQEWDGVGPNVSQTQVTGLPAPTPETRREGSPATALTPRAAPPKAKLTEARCYVPILSALVAVGGSGRASAVLERVHDFVRDELTAHDQKRLKSGDFRWRNTAMWARKHMIDEGLLSDSSPHGTWEITDQGRAYLAEHGADGA